MLTTVTLGAALLAPGLPQSPEAVVVTGVVQGGAMPLAALGLGDGGVGKPVKPPRSGEPGQTVTPGGVLVRAQAAGVKLDFPSGAELLMAPDGAVHLRDGGRTQASLHIVEVWLADGVRVRATRATGGGRGPLREVMVIDGDRAQVLWRRGLPLRQPAQAEPPGGACFLALGDGDALYRACALGPLIALERALCPRVRAGERPEQAVVIAGDVLVAGLRRLPEHFPRHLVQFPSAPEAAAKLATAAGALFPDGVLRRPPGAVGELVFGLVGGFRLTVEAREAGDYALGLYRGSVAVPAVEWIVGARTQLHMVRPDGGRGGGPRYYLRGLDLTAETGGLLALPRGPAEIRIGPRVLRQVGVRARALALRPSRG